MTDPGCRDDEGRDLRAALGGLLVDEPTAPWSVQDDVRRGQALRTRRRTRALGTVGIAAALVLLAGVLGPLRPWASHTPVGSSTPGLDEAAVSALLESYGWKVTDVVSVRTEPDPTVTTWSVAKGDNGFTASLTIRTWMSKGGSSPTGSALEACSRDRTCKEFSSTITDCIGSPCWSSTATTITTGDDVTPAGTAVLLGYDDAAGVAVELVARPAACSLCSQPVGMPPAFLTEPQLQQVLALVEKQLLGTPSPLPDPSGTPVVDGRACTSGDVKLIPAPDTVPGPSGAARLVVTVLPRNPDVDCVVTGHPTVVGLDRDGAALAYEQRNAGTEQPVRVRGSEIAVFRVSTSICAPVGGDLATLRVTVTPGGEPADVSVAMLTPVVSCAAGAQASTDMVVQAYEPAVEATPAEDGAGATG